MEVRVVWAACPPLEGDLGSFDSPAVAFLPRPFGPVVPEKESYTASPLRYFETHDARSFRNDARRGQSGTLSSCSKRSRRTIFIFSGVELDSQQIASLKAEYLYDAYLRSETLRVIRPYLVLGVVAVSWAILIWRTKFPTIMAEGEDQGNHGHFRELLKYPHFIWAVVAQFMYVGAQVGTWSYFIQYVQDSTHHPEKVAGYFLTGTLAAFALGRFISAYLMDFVAPSKLLGIYA